MFLPPPLAEANSQSTAPEPNLTTRFPTLRDPLEHTPFPQYILQRLGIKNRIIRNLINDIRQICKQIPLISIRENSRNTCVIKFDVFVVDADEVNCWVCGDERKERGVDYLGYVTLLGGGIS